MPYWHAALFAAQAHSGGDLKIEFDDSTSHTLRDRTYHGYDLTDVGEALRNLAGVIDGPDMVFDVLPSATGAPRRILRIGTPWLGQQGSSHVWELGGNAIRCTWPTDGTRVATRAYAVGEGVDLGIPIAVTEQAERYAQDFPGAGPTCWTDQTRRAADPTAVEDRGAGVGDDQPQRLDAATGRVPADGRRQPNRSPLHRPRQHRQTGAHHPPRGRLTHPVHPRRAAVRPLGVHRHPRLHRGFRRRRNRYRAGAPVAADPATPVWITGPLGDAGQTLVVPLVLGAVYALLRWGESRLPAWLARLLLGSATPPRYMDSRSAVE